MSVDPVAAVRPHPPTPSPHPTPRGAREPVASRSPNHQPAARPEAETPQAENPALPGHVDNPLSRMAGWVTIVQRVWSCGRQLRRWLNEQLGPWELTDSEFLLLYSCGECDGKGLAQQDLGGALGLSAARVSNFVDRLGRRELIRVERPERDRRRQLIQLTPAGRRLVDQILAALAPAAAALEQSAGGNRRETALQWLDHCRRAAG